MEKKSIKILLTNDNNTLLEGIVSALKHVAPHIEIVKEAINFQDLLKKLQETEFDILISDDRMQGECILTYLPGIKEKYPDLKIIINTIEPNETPDIKMMMEYSNGWLRFSSEPEDYVEAIETVYKEGRYYYKSKV